MKKIILLFFLICHLSLLSGNNSIQPQLLKSIDYGSKKGQLGVGKLPLHVYGSVPREITISPENEIYMVDTVNYRINIYDSGMNLLKTNSAKEEDLSNLEACRYMVVDEFHIIAFNRSLNIINNYAKRISFFPIPDKFSLSCDRLWLIKNYAIYYEKNQLKIIDVYESRYLNENEVEKLKEEGLKESSLFLNQQIQDKLKFFLNNTPYLLIGDRFLATYSNMKNSLVEFFKIVSQKGEKYDSKTESIIRNSNFFGFDKNNNYYFYRLGEPMEIFVISKRGELLTYNTINHDFYFPAVAPTGDIYYYVDDYPKRQFRFYRIPNTWDPITTNSSDVMMPSVLLPSKARITNLTASTFIDYLGMYAPSKAFDGQPETGWIEAGEGPGKGDYIKLEFANNITIDAIEVMPGYFDKKWWAPNNRVKQLKVFMDDTFETLNFEDIMEPQMINLKEPVTFRKIEFIIRDVYLSGKDNDTAIAEIGLYYQGEKLELDISGIE